MRPWPLVGREPEAELFLRVLGDPAFQGLLIHGPAGTGKTRLAEECRRLAAATGAACPRAAAGRLAQQVPLGAIGHLLPAATGAADAADPVALFNRAAESFERAGGRTVLFVDDLHLLDATSAILLGRLLDRGSIFLLGTVNSGPPVAEAVADLDRGERLARIDLSTLDAAAIGDLLRVVLGGPVNQATVLKLHHDSGGMLLFLRELVGGALASGALTGDGGVWRLRDEPGRSRRLDELIEARLRPLSAADRSTLERIALCGPVTGVNGLDPGSLTRLERAGLVRVELDGRRTLVTLGHPLYGDVVGAALPVMERRRLLTEQADRLAATGLHRRADRLRLATWRLAAGGSAEPALLWEAIFLARYAYDFGTVAALARPLLLLDRTAGPRMVLAEALHELGRTAEADTVLREAAEAAPDPHEFVLVSLLRSQLLIFSAFQLDEAAQVRRDLLARRDTARVREAVRVDEAWTHTLLGEAAAACAHLPVADADPDPRLRLAAALPVGWALADAGRAAQGVALGRRAYAEHMATPAATATAYPGMQQLARIQGLVQLGRVAEAFELATDAYGQAVTDRALLAQMWTAVCLGEAECRAGRVSAAYDWFATAATLAQDHNFRPCHWLARVGMALSAAAMGDLALLDEASARAAELAPAGHQRVEPLLVAAWRQVLTGDLSAARDGFLAAADVGRRTGAHALEVRALTDAARIGYPAAVTARLAALAETVEGDLAPACAALAAGLAGRSAAALERAADAIAALGVPLLAAEALFTAADRYTADGHRTRGLQAAGRAATLAADCPGARTPGLARPRTKVALTPREHEIALLSARGLSSQEIADRLTISVRTVDSHLLHVYRKTGITGRRDLPSVLPHLT